MEFSRQEYWSGLPFPSPRDLPGPGIEPGSHALQAIFFTILAMRETQSSSKGATKSRKGLLRSPYEELGLRGKPLNGVCSVIQADTPHSGQLSFLQSCFYPGVRTTLLSKMLPETSLTVRINWAFSEAPQAMRSRGEGGKYKVDPQIHAQPNKSTGRWSFTGMSEIKSSSKEEKEKKSRLWNNLQPLNPTLCFASFSVIDG